MHRVVKTNFAFLEGSGVGGSACHVIQRSKWQQHINCFCMDNRNRNDFFQYKIWILYINIFLYQIPGRLTTVLSKCTKRLCLEQHEVWPRPTLTEPTSDSSFKSNFMLYSEPKKKGTPRNSKIICMAVLWQQSRLDWRKGPASVFNLSHQ